MKDTRNQHGLHDDIDDDKKNEDDGHRKRHARFFPAKSRERGYEKNGDVQDHAEGTVDKRFPQVGMAARVQIGKAQTEPHRQHPAYSHVQQDEIAKDPDDQRRALRQQIRPVLFEERGQKIVMVGQVLAKVFPVGRGSFFRHRGDGRPGVHDHKNPDHEGQHEYAEQDNPNSLPGCAI